MGSVSETVRIANFINPSIVKARLVGRRTCRLGEGARLALEAKIANHQPSSEAISIGANSLVLGQLMTFGHGGRIALGEWCYVRTAEFGRERQLPSATMC